MRIGVEMEGVPCDVTLNVLKRVIVGDGASGEHTDTEDDYHTVAPKWAKSRNYCDKFGFSDSMTQ